VSVDDAPGAEQSPGIPAIDDSELLRALESEFAIPKLVEELRKK
jgi:hypothetical protein